MVAIPAQTRIGNYSIVELLGEGATSNCITRRRQNARVVAIKQLRRGGQSAIYQAMLHRVETGAQMHHKNIVHVLDADCLIRVALIW